MGSKNRQIAKNAVALYFRMIVMMLINFFTVRIVLKSLGVVDYGIYNVVGGFVTMFSLVSSSLLSSVSRSLTFELGKGDKERLKRTFSTSIYVLFGLLTIHFLSEVQFNGFDDLQDLIAKILSAIFWPLFWSVFTICVVIKKIKNKQ